MSFEESTLSENGRLTESEARRDDADYHRIDENESNDFFHPDCLARLNMIKNLIDSATRI